MWLNSRKILVVVGIAGFSMVGLLYMQVQLLKEDISLYEQQFDITIPNLLMSLQNYVNDDPMMSMHLSELKGKKEFTLFSYQDVPATSLEGMLKNKMDNLFLDHNLDLDYEIKGILAEDTDCLYHMEHDNTKMQLITSNLPLAGDIIGADNYLCLCGNGHNAFDITVNYPNKLGSVFSVNNPVLLSSIVLVGLIISCFAFTVITINKQKKLSEVKNDFINNLTHEFKTPIFSISLAAGLLRKSEQIKGSEDLMKYVDLIDGEGKRLKTQVDKVLQMALLDSGNFKLERKKVDAHKLIAKVARSFELIVNERNGKLNLRLEASNNIIYVDETHFNNIIYNLLDNAQKFCNDSPEITISTLDDDLGLAIIVKDNGIGMGEQAQKYIFDKFYRAESGNVHNVKGFGLGLSYVKKVVEAHKGRISLDSQPDYGSEFRVLLPFA